MIDGVLAKVFGTKHDREIKKVRPLVAAINDLEPQMRALSDADSPPRQRNSNNGSRTARPSTTC